MEKLKSSFRNMSLVLVAVAVITGALLAFMNHITEEPIRIQADKVLSDGIKDVMCNNNIFVDSADTIVMENNDKKEVFVVYRILGRNRDDVGVAIESSVMGFGGEMKVLVVLSKGKDTWIIQFCNHRRLPVSERRRTNGSQKEVKAIL